jgi:hypothetical protein
VRVHRYALTDRARRSNHARGVPLPNAGLHVNRARSRQLGLLGSSLERKQVVYRAIASGFATTDTDPSGRVGLGMTSTRYRVALSGRLLLEEERESWHVRPRNDGTWFRTDE